MANRTLAQALVAAAGVLLALAALVAPTLAQDAGTAGSPGSTGTTIVQVPAQDIVPAPNSGTEPHDAGDCGGALQLTLLALLVAAVGGAVALLVRQSRRARAA